MREEARVKVTGAQAAFILAPYVHAKLSEQLRSVLPIVGYLFLFQWFVLQMPVVDVSIISLGLTAVILGLMFFMEGLRIGLMPFAETIGDALPAKSSLALMLGFAFLLGVGATLAEPAVGALKSAGMNIKPEAAPLLYAMLTRYSGWLVMAVAVGVGAATVLGMLRFTADWSLKILIIPLVLALAGMTLWAQTIPNMASVIGLAWDTGGVTTGPVTVPLVLALGIGVCRALGKSDTGMSGFGIVTLASLLPILTVLTLGFVLHFAGADLHVSSSPGASAEARFGGVVASASAAAAQAILPLCAFLFVVLKFVLRERIANGDEIALGIGFALLGVALFNLGLALGLTPLGDQVGSTVPGAFSAITAGAPPEPLGPLYGSAWGKGVAVAFAFFLGYGATLAEPALNALGIEVEEVTVGALKKALLIQAVALGVGLGIASGVVKLIWSIPLIYLLLPPYLLLLVLSVISTEEMVNIGWDSAGVTTGPITVPLVIAMGLGLGKSLPGVVEGFGVIAMASVCPILTVLVMGLLCRQTAGV